MKHDQDETQNGYEYQAAVHMLYEGMIVESLTVIKAIRDRYDGKSRNPWNEFECGSNYARSMASYAILMALSGFEYDLVEGYVGFSPKLNQENFRCFYALNKSWGEFEHREGTLQLSVIFGELCIQSFRSELLLHSEVAEVTCGSQVLPFKHTGNSLLFDSQLLIDSGQRLCVTLK